MGWELVKDSENVKCWLNLDEIEIYTEGKYKGKRNWKNSIGKKFGVRYKWCHDEIEEKWFFINEYIAKNKNNNREPKICFIDNNDKTEHIRLVAKMGSGEFGKYFNKHTSDFKYKIGDEINDLKIIDKKYETFEKYKTGKKRKYYQYQCLKCGNIDWIDEIHLKSGGGCNVCCSTPRKVLKGVNDIATTHPHLCKYFVNKEDIYKYSAYSHKKVKMICPICGFSKQYRLSELSTKNKFPCSLCDDGISYPEKFMVNVLTQLNIKFITQLNHTTFNWCQNFKYDFYLTDFNMIIETHGEQHYRNAFQTYEETHKNDMRKCELARLNGFEMNKNYFVIDSRNSTLEWMKKNIIETLGHIFDLSNVDWEKADLESQKSHMILACQLKRENPDLTVIKIIEIIKEKTGIEYSRVTIERWLNDGTKLGLCHYSGKEELDKSNMKKKGKPIKQSKLIERYDLNGSLIDIKYQFEYVQMGFSQAIIGDCCCWYSCGCNLEEYQKHRKRKSPSKSVKLDNERYIFKFHDEQPINMNIKPEPKGELYSRFDLNGNFIDKGYHYYYKKMGFNGGTISSCAFWYSCGCNLEEYQKHYKNTPNKSVAPKGIKNERYIFKIYEENDTNGIKINYTELHYKLISRFDLNGNFIDKGYQFEYVQMGFNQSGISNCCKFWEMNCDKEKWNKLYKRKPFKQSGGFIWKYAI